MDINNNNNNFLVLKHRKISREEVSILLEKYSLSSTSKLPKISIKDPAISNIEDLSLGDVIEITRNSFAGENKYFRVVIE
jgi:DNA-directed RNA polymerase subunit H (RpoH/RPB5)